MVDSPVSPRVLLVDDHEIYRAGLRGLLEEAGIDIVGEAATGEAAVELVEEKHPNVVIMDLNMPGIGGIDATRQISMVAPLARVIMLTVSSAAPDPTSASLTGREHEVLRLLSSGMDNAEIGRTLFISPSTVKNHISSILLKLQIENRIQAAVYAVRSGLV